MGSLFGSSTKPKKSILYDENYATLDSVPQSSSITGVGGGSSGTTYQRNGSFVPPLSTGSGMRMWIWYEYVDWIWKCASDMSM